MSEYQISGVYVTKRKTGKGKTVYAVRVKYVTADSSKEVLWKSLGNYPSKREAEKKKREVLNSEEQPKVENKTQTPGPKIHTFGEVAIECFQYREKFGWQTDNGILILPTKEITKKQNISVLKNGAAEIWNEDIRTLNARQLLNLYAKLKLAPVIKRKFKSLLLAVFNYALRLNYIDQIPINPNLLTLSKEDVELMRTPKEKVVLTPRQVESVKDGLRSLGESQRFNLQRREEECALIDFMYETGCRYHEAASVRFCNILEDNGIYYYDLKEQWIRDRMESLKTRNSIRKIPLSPKIIQLIERQRDLYGRIYPDVSDLFVFGGEKPIPETTFYRHLKQAVQIARESDPTLPQKVTSHLFRHSYTSRLISAGVPLPEISEVTGHGKKGLLMTVDVYGHKTESDAQKVLRALDSPENEKRTKSGQNRDKT